MKSIIRILTPSVRLGLGLAALFPAHSVLADDNNIRVDVVVNMTEEGDKLPRPNPQNPTYYLPYTAGYTELGGILTGEKPPPPTLDVQRMLGRALADRGYTVMDRKHHPSIILVLWWGYMAPISGNPYGDTANGSVANPSSGGIYITGVGLSNATLHGPSSGNLQTPGNTYNSVLPGMGMSAMDIYNSAGLYTGQGIVLPTGALQVNPNDHQMFTLVAGGDFEEQIGNWDSFGAADSLHEAARHPRYFMMVSALDFQAATQRKPVLLWCARVSTERAGHTLAGVLPTLIATGVQKFGEETDGRPKFSTVPAIPMGRVLVGIPVIKTSYPDKPASP
jgi:hypothetical protein